MPRENLHRAKKGFGIPVHEWFRGELLPLARERLTTPGCRIHRYLRREALEYIVESHARGRTNEGARLWLWLCLELWLEWIEA